MEPQPWETLAVETVLDEPWYRVRRETVQLPDGRVLDDYFVSVRPEVALVVAVTAREEVVLVRQWKQGARSILVELPGGLCDEGEPPAEAARRELLEETGYAGVLEPLASWFSEPSKTTNRVHVFLARDAEQVAKPQLDETESVEVVLLPLAEAAAAAGNGRIGGVSSAAGLLAALQRLRAH